MSFSSTRYVPVVDGRPGVSGSPMPFIKGVVNGLSLGNQTPFGYVLLRRVCRSGLGSLS